MTERLEQAMRPDEKRRTADSFVVLKRVYLFVEGEGTMSRVEGNSFFFQSFFGKGNNQCN